MSALFEPAVNMNTVEAKKKFILVNLVVRLLFTMLRNTTVTKSMKAIQKRRKECSSTVL